MLFSLCYFYIIYSNFFIPYNNECNFFGLVIFDKISKIFTLIILFAMSIIFLASYPMTLTCEKCIFPFFGIIFVLNSALSLGYYTRLIKRIYFEEPREGIVSFKLSIYELISLMIILIYCCIHRCLSTNPVF